MKAVILAAGEGKRLEPLTNQRPKPMLPVATQPVLKYVGEAVASAGVDEVVLVVGYKRDRIQTHFGDGELKHGTLALVTEDTPVIAVLTDGANADETLRNVKEVESRDTPVVGAFSPESAESFLDASFSVPELGDLKPLVANVYLQLFAYHVADELGRKIDNPRNLAKSVRVE